MKYFFHVKVVLGSKDQNMFTRQHNVNAKIDTNMKTISKTKVIYLCVVIVSCSSQEIYIRVIVQYY